MATTTVKKKKFNLTSLLTLIFQVLPVVLDSLNNGSESSQILVEPDGKDGALKAHVVIVDKRGSMSMRENVAYTK